MGRVPGVGVGVRTGAPLCDLSGSKPRSVSLENHPTERALKMRRSLFSTSINNSFVEICYVLCLAQYAFSVMMPSHASPKTHQ